MTTSKSFRAILPPISEEEVQRLRAWSAENCAAATVFRESECVIWLASKERARSREAFLRSVRGVLKKRLAIDVTSLRDQQRRAGQSSQACDWAASAAGARGGSIVVLGATLVIFFSRTKSPKTLPRTSYPCSLAFFKPWGAHT